MVAPVQLLLQQMECSYGNGTCAVQVTAAGTNGQLFFGVTAGAPAFGTMSGDAAITNAGVITIAANAVALTTDTTGNYVATITDGNGISGSSSIRRRNTNYRLRSPDC